MVKLHLRQTAEFESFLIQFIQDIMPNRLHHVYSAYE